jgi:hypothetical protein
LNAFLFEQAGQVRSLESQEFGGFDLTAIGEKRLRLDQESGLE